MKSHQDKSVLIITSEFPPNVGGIGNHAYNLAKSLAEKGFLVTVMCDIINVENEALNHFSSQEKFSIVWNKRGAFVLNTYLQRIRKAKKYSARAQTIICSGKFPLWLGMIIRQFNKRKNLIAVVHGSELDLKSNFAKKVTGKSLNKFDKIVSVSNYTQRFLPASLNPAIKKVVIPNGINLSDFTNTFSKQKLGGEPSLITVGSVTERKGQQNVINALPAIQQKFPGVHYHVIGKPIEQKQIEALSNKLRVQDRITFYGAIGRDELLQKLASSKIKLMLSVHTAHGEFEGFGIAVLEANALGIPVIGSRNSGIADAVEDGKTGLLVDPTNTEEIAEAVSTINENYSFYSANAKSWAVKHDWKIIVEKYIEVIES